MAKKAQQVRVIAGKWKGRKINFNDEEHLRPTSDRIRETLFNWIMPYIKGSKCLDLFAGSGILGIESLSRGASSVTAVEYSNSICSIISDNIKRIEIPNYTLVNQDAIYFLDNLKTFNYDIVFLDPPFSIDCVYEILSLLGNKDKNFLIYVEQNKELEKTKLENNFVFLKEKKAGNVFYYLLEKTFI